MIDFGNGHKWALSRRYLITEPADMQDCGIDSMSSKVYQHAAGAKKGHKVGSQSWIGISRGEKNTKIHTIVDGFENPVKLMFTGGNIHDSKAAIPTLAQININGSIVMGDKAYGSKEIREYSTTCGATYAIPPQSNNPDPWECDWWQYKERHLVECFFHRLQHFRRVAIRYDKTISSFSSFVFLASSMILLK